MVNTPAIACRRVVKQLVCQGKTSAAERGMHLANSSRQSTGSFRAGMPDLGG